ncbi:hypothetical protein DFH94DRAFT_842031 [Russula ochroleuca]|uniref:Uncharacterized protein n=1 Tax=Russula ochroleuca TaxID=152965 RepID=A0A9P5TDK2_9AGAM|nr:hypothetical protein DFH94DRAFT_842031 [Russula ochroleuca]
MTRIADRNHHSDDDQQWEDVPDEKWVPRSFKGAASVARTRRTMRQRFPATPPRKPIPELQTPQGLILIVPPNGPIFRASLNVECKTFEPLLDEAVEGLELALEIKKAETETSDLATLVWVSELNSREILADSLNKFVKNTRKVGRGLTRFSSKVGDTVDSIIDANDNALRRIEVANSQSRGLSLRRLWGSSQASTKEVVTRTFTEAMDALSTNMRRLVLEAKVSISDLNKLEEHLRAIHGVVSDGESSFSAARDELLAEPWTILGGNRKELNEMDKHLAVLRGLGGYRHRVLESTAEEMEELRGRVDAPELDGDAIPIDVHIESIRSGLDRLKELRIGAK